MKINVTNFRNVLKEVHAGVDSRGLIQQSDCFIFFDGMVCSFSDEVCIRGESGLSKDFEGAIHAENLFKFILQVTDEEIEVDHSLSELILEGEEWRSGFSLQSEISLPVDLVEEPSSWKYTYVDLCEALAMVGDCTSSDLSRFESTCVHITPHHVEATDNGQCCRWTLETGIEESTIIRQQALKNLTPFSPQEFSETEKWLHFRNAKNTILSCRKNPDSKFPNLNNIMKAKGNIITFPREEMLESIGKASLFVKDEKDKLVSLHLSQEESLLRGYGEHGWFEKTLPIEWQCEKMSFSISPLLLSKMLKNHSDFYLSDKFLSVEGVSWVWVGCIQSQEVAPTKKKRKKVHAS